MKSIDIYQTDSHVVVSIDDCDPIKIEKSGPVSSSTPREATFNLAGFNVTHTSFVEMVIELASNTTGAFLPSYKITAIKAVRRLLSCGLKEAKDIVDNIVANRD